MRFRVQRVTVLLFLTSGVLAAAGVGSGATAAVVLSGGCYWTMEAVFEHVRGVSNVVSGTAGRNAGPQGYARNPSGTLGLAEAVQITYHPSQVSLAELLHVFFTVAHDPAQVNRQGPDIGTRYRSVIWTSNDEQRETVSKIVAKLETGASGMGPISTQIATLDRFEPVADREQDFAVKYPDHPYVLAWDRPKLEQFRRVLPQLYRRRLAQP